MPTQMPTQMSTQENTAAVRRMIERSMIAGDIEAGLAAYAPDLVYHNPATPGGTPGVDTIRMMQTVFRSAFPDARYTIEATIAEADKVAVLYRWRGTNTGPFGPLPPTGRVVGSIGMMVCRLAGGKIVEEWDIDDRLDVMQQLGMLPAPRQAAGEAR